MRRVLWGSFLWIVLVILVVGLAARWGGRLLGLFDLLWDRFPLPMAQDEASKVGSDRSSEVNILYKGLVSSDHVGDGSVPDLTGAVSFLEKLGKTEGVLSEDARSSAKREVVRNSKGRGVKWLALVVDDMGYDVSAAKRIASLGLPMTWAIIPGAPHAREVSEVARSYGIPYLVHVPMKALSDGASAGSVVVAPDMAPGEIRRRAAEAFDALPGAVGVNNHRGSAATADIPAMEAFMTALKERRPGWFFLDSRTNPRSVAYKVALEKGLVALRNGYFIDAVPGGEVDALKSAIRGAYKSGHGIAIGHPRRGTIEVLSRLARGEMALPDGLILVSLPQVVGTVGGGLR